MSDRNPSLTHSPEAHEELSSRLRGTNISHGLALRARIILRLAESDSPTAISYALDVSRKTICKWQDRFIQPGFLDRRMPQGQDGLQSLMMEQSKKY